MCSRALVSSAKATLPSVSPEVRADDGTREAYEQVLRSIIDEVSAGLGDLPGDHHDDRDCAARAPVERRDDGARSAIRDPRSGVGRAHRECGHALCERPDGARRSRVTNSACRNAQPCDVYRPERTAFLVGLRRSL